MLRAGLIPVFLTALRASVAATLHLRAEARTSMTAEAEDIES